MRVEGWHRNRGLLPMALTTHVSVRTARCTLFNGRRGCLRLDEMRDAFDHLVDVMDLLCLLVADLDFKLALKVKKDVEAIKRIDPQGLEAAFGINTLKGDALRGCDDF